MLSVLVGGRRYAGMTSQKEDFEVALYSRSGKACTLGEGIRSCVALFQRASEVWSHFVKKVS